LGRAPPEAGAFDNPVGLVVPVAFVGSPFPTVVFTPSLAVVLVDFVPAIPLEPILLVPSVSFALGLAGFAPLDLVLPFAALTLEVALAEFPEDFLTPPSGFDSGCTISVLVAAPSFSASSVVMPAVEEASLGPGSVLSRRLGVAGVTMREGGSMLTVPLGFRSTGISAPSSLPRLGISSVITMGISSAWSLFSFPWTSSPVSTLVSLSSGCC